jgi:hypothetical protein
MSNDSISIVPSTSPTAPPPLGAGDGDAAAPWLGAGWKDHVGPLACEHAPTIKVATRRGRIRRMGPNLD